jgi:hypothetical protein
MSNNRQYASTARSVRQLQHSMSKKSTLLRRTSKPYVENKIMKLTLKQRIRNWLMNDDEIDDDGLYASTSDSEGPNIQSQSFRLNVYSAGGGIIIETTKYDRQKDDHRYSLYIVTDDKDLGEELAKIITMENLR